MLDLSLTWNILFLFEIVLFSSYTLIMYTYSEKKEILSNDCVSSKDANLPTISFIIPMYNEEKVIKEKIENTSRLEYPGDKIEIILLDDHSKDNSSVVSEETISTLSLDAKVIRNQGGKGKARALNWIFPSLKNEITVISDADALLKEDALLQLVKHYNDPEIGGVTGKILILADKERLSKVQEDSYRFYFDIWRRGESQIHSVSVCNGPLMSFRTELLHKIRIDPNAYADDSDMLFKVIRRGFRVVYEADAIVFERIPLSMRGRTIQKMKRINGLRKVYFNNLSLLGRSKFGTIIYPYALLTHIVSPVIVLILSLLYPFLVLGNPEYMVFLVPFVVPKIGNALLSFLTTQIIMNFSFMVKTSGSWEAISDARYALKQKI